MAFLIKTTNKARAAGATGTQQAVVDQQVHAARAGAVLPATTTQNIFQVLGGRVLVKCLIGQVTTICSATATNCKVSATAKDNTGATVGTAVDLCSNVLVTSKEVGANYVCPNDGTAGIVTNAGAGLSGAKPGYGVVPQGIISITTDATNTGAFKWDIFYQPLDEGAYVVAL